MVTSKAHMLGIDSNSKLSLSHETSYIVQARKIVTAFDLRLPVLPVALQLRTGPPQEGLPSPLLINSSVSIPHPHLSTLSMAHIQSLVQVL